MESNAITDLRIVQSERRNRFVLFAEIAMEANKRWLLAGILGEGEASVFYGKPGEGKSVLVEDLALHIAAGKPWHGRTIKAGAVVYVALERSGLVKRRAIASRKKYGVEDLPFAIIDGVFDFREASTADMIADVCREVDEVTAEKVVLVVIDTLSRALAGGDENSPKDMGAVVTTLSRILKATGAHVLLVHHMPQTAERMRGHGSLEGAVDTTVFVSRSGAYRTAEVVKANDSEEGVRVTFDLESVVIGTDGDDETTAPIVIPVDATPKTETGPRLTKNEQSFFRLLHEAGSRGLSTSEWNAKAREIGLGIKRRADLSDWASSLKSKGVVRESPEGHWSVRHAD